MAETKNYVSKYSGDQLDAAIAVLGSLETMFFSQEDFAEFTKDFDKKMRELKDEVTKLMTLNAISTFFSWGLNNRIWIIFIFFVW